LNLRPPGWLRVACRRGAGARPDPSRWCTASCSPSRPPGSATRSPAATADLRAGGRRTARAVYAATGQRGPTARPASHHAPKRGRAATGQQRALASSPH